MNLDPALPILTSPDQLTGRKPRRDDVVLAEILRLNAQGQGVGRFGEYSVVVRHALPGSSVVMQVGKRRRHRLEGRVLELRTPGTDAVPPRCAHFAACGGCSFQDLAYPAQLAELERIGREVLAGLPGAEDVTIAPIARARTVFGYRNKMDFTFGNRRYYEEGEPPELTDDFALGLHAPGRHDKVLDVERCDLAFPEASVLLGTARRLALEQGLTPWDLREHTGLLRHLVLRKGMNTGELLAYLVTSEDANEVVDAWGAAFVAAHPELSTLVQGVNTRPATIAVGERERVVHGPGTIRERLGGLEFTISPTAFFQTNSEQAELLFERVRAEAAPSGDEVVWDLYCGAGSIGLSLAGACREVWGFERLAAAVADARANASRNGIQNAHFEEADVGELLRPELRQALGAPSPDVCIVDPPRAGLHPRVPAALAALGPRRIVYVSCNPASAVRDAVQFDAVGYRVRRAFPIDLFPHTPHLEVVLTLEPTGSAE